MLSIGFAIAPIFLLILLGHGLRRGGIPSLEFWNQNDKLVYWVLFPCLLFHKVSTAELSAAHLGGFALTVYAGFAAAIVFALVLGRLVGYSPAMWTSVLQGSARHNTFIALAVAERVYGAEGLALAALITALLVPVTNVSMVSLMLAILRRDPATDADTSAGGPPGPKHPILRELGRNPLLIAIALGLAVNLSGIGLIPILHDVTAILGVAALPIVLLCVGANIRMESLVSSASANVVSIVGKMLIFPLVVGVVVVQVGLEPPAALIAMVFAAVPTSAGAYTLARQLGGDAPAMASIVAVQTAVSFVTLPLVLSLAPAWFAH